MADQEMTPEQLAEEIRKLKISDLLVSTCSTLAQLGFAKLDRETRDLPQARLAVDSLRALLQLLEGEAPDHVVRDFRQVVTNLQLAFAAAAAEAGPSAPEPERE